METKLWDPAHHIDGDEAILACIDAGFEERDAVLVSAVSLDVARGRGGGGTFDKSGAAKMMETSSGLGAHPDLGSVLRSTRAVGLRLFIDHV